MDSNPLKQQAASKVHPIDHVALRQLIREQNLKHEFLASSLRVAPLTINRWISGKTRNIQHQHLIMLAGLLNCDPCQLIRKAQLIAPVPAAQKRILKLLDESNSFGKLAALEEYDLIEACLESSYSDELAPSARAKIFYLLAVCSYKKEKYQSAKKWLKIFFELDASKDADLNLKAEQLMASMYILESDYASAENWFDRIFARDLTKYSDDTLSLLYSNYGYFHFRRESYLEAAVYIEKSFEYVNFDMENSYLALNRCSSLRILIECAHRLDKRLMFNQYLADLVKLAKRINHSYSLYRVALFQIEESIADGNLEQAYKSFWQIADLFPQHLDWYFLTKGHRLHLLLDRLDQTEELWRRVSKHPSCDRLQWQQDINRMTRLHQQSCSH